MYWGQWIDSERVLEPVQVVWFAVVCWDEWKLLPRNRLDKHVGSWQELAVQLYWTVHLQAAVIAEAL
jgi:hypothetical protein